MKVDKVANMKVDMEVYKVADMEVDLVFCKVADMEVKRMADMEVFKMVDMVADMDFKIIRKKEGVTCGECGERGEGVISNH